MEVLFGLELFLLFMATGLFILWIWALVDIITSRFKEDFMQIVWLLVVFFLPFIGVLIYLLIGRSMRRTANTYDDELSQKYDHLGTLKKLWDEGTITEAEFVAEKQKILNH